MVCAVINPSAGQQWIALIIILGFAIFGAVKGLYGMITPVVSVILSIMTGIIISGRIDPIAGSRFLTFLIISALAWGIIRLLVKLGDKVRSS